MTLRILPALMVVSPSNRSSRTASWTKMYCSCVSQNTLQFLEIFMKNHWTHMWRRFTHVHVYVQVFEPWTSSFLSSSALYPWCLLSLQHSSGPKWRQEQWMSLFFPHQHCNQETVHLDMYWSHVHLDILYIKRSFEWVILWQFEFIFTQYLESLISISYF